MTQDTAIKNPVSMKDIAEYLGVSKATVSRALSGRSEISVGMRQKVNNACEKLGYRLNPNIQDLVLKNREGNTRNIGFVLVERDFSDPTYALLIDGIAEGIKKYYYNLMLLTLTGEERGIFDLPPVLRDGRLDGILLSGNLSVPVMTALKKLEIKIVVLGIYSPVILKGVSNVQPNLEKRAYESVEMAVKSGCKRIAMFEEAPTTFFNVQAYNYIKAAAIEYGVEFDKDNFYLGTGPYSGAIKTMKPVFKQEKLLFDCMICWDFRTAGELAVLLMGRTGLDKDPDLLLLTERVYPHFSLPVPALYIESGQAHIALAGVEYLIDSLKHNSKTNNSIQIQI